MSLLIYIFGSIFLISLVSLVGIVFLSLSANFLKSNMMMMVSFSTGALLGNVFFHLLPEIVSYSTAVERGFFLILLGILTSFVVEKFIHWRHCHDIDCEGHVHPVGSLVLFGDAIHNVIDGILITTAYLVSPALGVSTTLAVLLHEIPQEIGDFAVLLHSGFTKKKALLLNFCSALTAVLGAVLVLIVAQKVQGIEELLLPLAAGNFLYIAGSDLIPELHKETSIRRTSLQLLWILTGVGLLYLLSTSV